MALRPRSLGARWLAPFLVAAFWARTDSAQEHDPRGARGERGEPAPEVVSNPSHAFELALSGDGIAFGYRSGLYRGNGFTSLGLFVSEDDDIAVQARLMRFGEPSAKAPLGLGVGIGLFGAHVDRNSDELLAITLTGSVDWAFDGVFDLAYPLRAGVELSYAPDISTFLDGSRVLDVLARLESDLSSWATAFVGYRHLEVDIEDGRDARLDRAFEAGVRLGF